MGTGAASLLEGAVGTPAASYRPLWSEQYNPRPSWNEQLKYLPKEAGVVGEGRVIVSGCGPGAVSAIGKRRDELPMCSNLGPHLESRILVASRYGKDGIYRGVADRPQIEKTHPTSTVLTMDTLIRLIAFHCLSYTFHCYPTYDPDYFRDADRFPGWDSLCLDPPGFWIYFGCVCVRSRIPIPCLLKMCDLRSAHSVCVSSRPPSEFTPSW